MLQLSKLRRNGEKAPYTKGAASVSHWARCPWSCHMPVVEFSGIAKSECLKVWAQGCNQAGVVGQRKWSQQNWLVERSADLKKKKKPLSLPFLHVPSPCFHTIFPNTLMTFQHSFITHQGITKFKNIGKTISQYPMNIDAEILNKTLASWSSNILNKLYIITKCKLSQEHRGVLMYKNQSM